MAQVTPGQVFGVLRDGHLYAQWVVGARAIRDVDAGWPQPGTRLHYTVGRRPLRKDDVTESKVYRPDETLELEAQAWPAGTASITITATAEGDGTTVVLDEAPAQGPGKVLHNPLFDLMVNVRNRRSLQLLERVVRQH